MLKLTLSSVQPQTKADNGDDDAAIEGNSFCNVLVVIANSSGKVIDRVFKEYPCEASGFQTAVTTDSLVQDLVYFHDLKVGAYQVYAYANIKQTDWQKQGETIEEVEGTLTASGTTLLDEFRTLRTLTSAVTDTLARPKGKNRGMLLTGHKELYVGVNENIGEVELLRPVVRFNVYVHNHTPFSLTLNKLSFNKFYASNTYLLDHRNTDGTPSIPSGVNYRSLPPYDEEHAKVVEAPADNDAMSGRELVYTQLMYENKIKGDYRLFATITLDAKDADNNVIPIVKELTTDGVRLVTFDEMNEMEAGESKKLMIVNPNSKNGNFFGWSGSKLGYSNAKYGLVSSFNAHAVDLLKNSEIGSYYVFTVTRTNDGRFTFHHINQTTDYNFLKQVSGVTDESLTLEEGTVALSNQDYPVPLEYDGYLFRLRDSQNRYVYNYDNKLKADGTNIGFGNRMWAFYEAYPKGSVLKFIDNETAQVKPLGYMLRNQELNVVLNVYYQEVLHSITFDVENTYWSDTPHTPSVEFK